MTFVDRPPDLMTNLVGKKLLKDVKSGRDVFGYKNRLRKLTKKKYFFQVRKI